MKNIHKLLGLAGFLFLCSGLEFPATTMIAAPTTSSVTVVIPLTDTFPSFQLNDYFISIPVDMPGFIRDPQFELCFPLGITGTLGGGISGTIFAKQALDASILLRGTLSAEPVRLCVSPSFKIEGSSKVCSSLDAVGTVKLLSLVTIQGVWPIVGKSCFPLF